jgi:hypothetical protein
MKRKTAQLMTSLALLGAAVATPVQALADDVEATPTPRPEPLPTPPPPTPSPTPTPTPTPEPSTDDDDDIWESVGEVLSSVWDWISS